MNLMVLDPGDTAMKKLFKIMPMENNYIGFATEVKHFFGNRLKTKDRRLKAEGSRFTVHGSKSDAVAKI